MKKATLLIAAGSLVLALATTQANAAPAAAGPRAPGGTPGPPATAQRASHGKPTVYRGIISSVDATSLTLETAGGPAVTLALTPETRIRVPGPKAEGDVLLVGMRVVVQAVAGANDTLTARSVTAIPGKPTRSHRVGTVTEYAAGVSITILATDGNSYTFALTADTKILPPALAGTLAVDARVTIIAPRDPASLGSTAKGIVVHPPKP